MKATHAVDPMEDRRSLIQKIVKTDRRSGFSSYVSTFLVPLILPVVKSLVRFNPQIRPQLQPVIQHLDERCLASTEPDRVLILEPFKQVRHGFSSDMTDRLVRFVTPGKIATGLLIRYEP